MTGIEKSKRSVLFILLFLFILAHFFHHIVPAIITPLLPFIRESFELDYTKAGVLISAFNLAYGASQLPGGLIAKHTGLPLLITIGISGVAFLGFLTGLSPNFIFMALCLVFMGIIGGGYHPSASPLISQAVDQRHRGKALGIHQIGGTASFFIGPLIAVALARVFGWRGSFIALSIPIFLFGIFFYTLLKRWGYGKARYKKKTSKIEESQYKADLTRKLVPVILLNIFTQVFLFSSLSFIPLFIVDSLGGSKEVAAALLSLAHSAGLWAGPLSGFLSDKIGKSPVIIFNAITTAPLLLLLNHVSLGLSVSIVLMFIGMSHYMGMPVAESYIISHSPPKHRTTILGLYYFISRGGPGLVAPLLGFLIDKYSFQTAFITAGISMGTITIICTAFILGGIKRTSS